MIRWYLDYFENKIQVIYTSYLQNESNAKYDHPDDLPESGVGVACIAETRDVGRGPEVMPGPEQQRPYVLGLPRLDLHLFCLALHERFSC